MGEFAQQVVIVVGVLAACFVGPALAAGFLGLAYTSISSDTRRMRNQCVENQVRQDVVHTAG